MKKEIEREEEERKREFNERLRLFHEDYNGKKSDLIVAALKQGYRAVYCKMNEL